MYKKEKIATQVWFLPSLIGGVSHPPVPIWLFCTQSLPKNTIPSNSSRHYHSKYHEVPTLYSRDPGGPLVLKSHKSSGIDTEQKTAILQQVKAERPCCQNDFVWSLSHC